MFVSLLAAAALGGPYSMNFDKPADSVNELGVELFQQARKGQPGANILISPLSISICLAMAANGADGETWSGMSKGLHFEGASHESMNSAYKQLNDSLTTADPSTRMEIANALWANQQIRFETPFVNELKESFQGEARALDFSSPSAIPTMNDWVKEKTHDKIERIVENLPADSLMVLMNAISFKGDWTAPFDKRANYDSEFTGAQGKSAATFMRKAGHFHYAEVDGAQYVQIPYGNQRFMMEILLPSEGGLQKAIDGMSSGSWNEWRLASKSRHGFLMMPKWQGDTKLDLSPMLKSGPMAGAFDARSANFTRMVKGTPAFIGQVLHKTFVKVDEKGTEAAAVTATVMRAGSAIPQDSFNMKVERSFLYTISEAETGAILFLGVVEKP